jgi:hypothetical protein
VLRHVSQVHARQLAQSKQGQPEQKDSPQERTQASQGKQAEAKAEAANGKKPAQLPACPTFKQKSNFDFTF